MKTKAQLITAATVLAIAVIGFGMYRLVSHREGGSHGVKGGEIKTIYTCPMHPTYTSDKPGECPICGMTLVPAKAENKMEHGGHSTGTADKTRTAITIDGERQQRIGVRTESVAKGPAQITIRATGRVTFDPELAVAQREFLEATRSGDRQIAEAARKRLTLMGMGEDEFRKLSQRGRPDENLVLPGKSAWVYVAVYERELQFVRPGQGADIQMPDGGVVGSGTIRAVDPVLDPATRTVRARIEVADPHKKLRPNMFVTAILRNDLGERLLVPKAAVIDSGVRKLAFVVHDKEHFVPHEITVGPELEEDYVVESGLSEGDVVATSALFLIDSESQLKAAAGLPGGHGHD